jgi:hypothetical protein
MHEVGEKLHAALAREFPEADPQVREDRHTLNIRFRAEGRQYVIRTPENVDYRHLAYQVWLHRAAELIRGKAGAS